MDRMYSHARGESLISSSGDFPSHRYDCAISVRLDVKTNKSKVELYFLMDVTGCDCTDSMSNGSIHMGGTYGHKPKSITAQQYLKMG